MKTIIYFSLLLMAFTVSAQNPKFNREKAKATIEAHIESLYLDKNQKIQFEEINKKHQKKLEKIKNSDQDRVTKFQYLKELRQERDEEMKLLLNEEQFKMHEQFKIQNKKKMREEFKMRHNN